MSDNGRSALRTRALLGAVVLLVGLVFVAGIGSAAPDVVVDDGGDCPDADATSVQAALADNATAGDVVEVCAGTYGETVTVDQRLSLVANATGGAVVVDGGGSRAVGFAVADGADDVTIRGFTVQNVTDGGVRTGGSNANLTVWNNTVSGVASSTGYGVLLSAPSTGVQADLNVSANTFVDVAGTAVSVSPGDTLRDVTVAGNDVRTSGTALAVGLDGGSLVERLDVRDNAVGNGTESGIVLDAGATSSATVRAVTVAGNVVEVQQRSLVVRMAGSTTATDLVLERNDLTVTGTGDGVELVSTDSATVSSVRIARNAVTARTHGVDVVATGANAITDVNVSENEVNESPLNGIRFDNVNESIVSYNQIAGNGDGIQILSSSRNMIFGNILLDDEILVAGGALNNISENEIKGDTHSILIESSDYSQVFGNMITSASYEAVNITSTNGTVVAGNSLTANGGDGLVLHGVTNATVRANTVSTSGGHGVLLTAGSSDNRVRDNTVADNTVAGLRLDGGGGTVAGNVLANNTVRGNAEAGVELAASARDTLLVNNTAVDNRVGMLLGSDSVERTTLRGNDVSANDVYGFSVTGADRNAFADNVALDNGRADYRSGSDAVDNVVTGLRLSSADVSFEARDVAVSGTSARPGGYPVGVGNGLLAGFVNATNTSADSYLALNVSYAQADVTGLAESTLGVWRHDGTGWTEAAPVSGVDTAESRVFANTTAFGTFAPLGEYTTELAFCREVARPGWYTMVRNVTGSTSGGCFAVTAGDVTLDGDGYTVSGAGDAAVNTELASGSLDNVTVTDVQTVGFDVGVKLVDVTGGTVHGVTATGHGTAGVSLDGVVGGHVVGSDANANAGDGIRVHDSRDVVLRDDDVSDNGRAGVDVVNVTDLAIVESRLTRNRVGVNVSADTAALTVAVHGNDIVANGAYGVDNRNETAGTWVDARNNWWGAADGPGTALDETTITGPLADPVSGRLADGTGDNVSAMGETAPDNATANVRFDAVLTERYGASTPASSTSDGADGGTTATADGGSGGSGGGGASGADVAGDVSDPNLVRVVAASLSEGRATPGSSVTVTAVVRNDRESPARFTATLLVDGDAVDRRTVTVPAASDLPVGFERQFDATGRYTLGVDDVDAGTFVVGGTGATETQNQVETDRSTRPADPTATAEAVTATATPEPVAADATGRGLARAHLLVALLVLLALLSGGYYLFRREGAPVGNPPGE